RAFVGALALGAVVVVVAAVVRFGNPVEMSRSAYRSFTAPPVRVHAGTSLNTRLFSLSAHGRIGLWRAVWHVADAHHWLCCGVRAARAGRGRSRAPAAGQASPPASSSRQSPSSAGSETALLLRVTTRSTPDKSDGRRHRRARR